MILVPKPDASGVGWTLCAYRYMYPCMLVYKEQFLPVLMLYYSKQPSPRGLGILSSVKSMSGKLCVQLQNIYIYFIYIYD